MAPQLRPCPGCGLLADTLPVAVFTNGQGWRDQCGTCDASAPEGLLVSAGALRAAPQRPNFYEEAA